MDLLLLKYITARLKDIERLEIQAWYDVTVNKSITSSEEVESVIHDLRLYCEKKIKGEVFVDLEYPGRDWWVYIYHQGQK